MPPKNIILRHCSPNRTRLSILALRRRPHLCLAMEKELIKSEFYIELSQFGIKILTVEARPKTGSLIIQHSQKLPSLLPLYNAVERVMQRTQSSSRGVQKSLHHISGCSLLISGGYLVYLITRQLVTSVAVPLLSFATVVTMLISLPIQRQAFTNLRENKRLDMSFISTLLLYYSLATGNVLTSLSIFWLFNLSSWLESRIQQHTRQSIRDLLTMRPSRVWLQKDGIEIEVESHTLQKGDVIILRLGDVIPIDGVVLSGLAQVDESILSGEAEPVVKRAKTTHTAERYKKERRNVESDRVFNGTTLTSGEIVVRVEKAGEETRLASIVRMIETAENTPGNILRASERVSRVMVPIAFVAAGTVLIFSGSLMQAMAMLIICCPCALRLSSSVAISSTMAEAAREGILIKRGDYLETAAELNCIVFDKTGTLTNRKNCTSVKEEAVEQGTIEFIPLDGRIDEKKLILLAAAMQRIWPHPTGCFLRKMAEQVVGNAESEDVKSSVKIVVENCEHIVGFGVKAEFNGESLFLGSFDFLKREGVLFSPAQQKIITSSCREKPYASTLFFAKKNRCYGFFQTWEGLEPNHNRERQGIIRRLQKRGVCCYLLSGDTQESCTSLGRRIGVDDAIGELTPERKAQWIKNLRIQSDNSTGRKGIGATRPVIAMVGDGVNDTPAFAAADLAIAVADGGSDIAVEYADIVLQYGAVEQVERLYQLANDMRRRIFESHVLAISLNMIALIGVGSGLLNPITGALLHNGITVAVVAHAAKIKKLEYKSGKFLEEKKSSI